MRSLSQSEIAQDKQDNHDEADNVYDLVHSIPTLSLTVFHRPFLTGFFLSTGVMQGFGQVRACRAKH